MQRTGGEPDVIGRDKQTGEIIFCDCSPETPQGRVNCCSDRDALKFRKATKPASSALDMAAAMGVEILTEAEYRELQKLGEFDYPPPLGGQSWFIDIFHSPSASHRPASIKLHQPIKSPRPPSHRIRQNFHSPVAIHENIRLHTVPLPRLQIRANL
jgi:hypothetical protein